MGVETPIDYIAANTNALNFGLLGQRPDHYRRNHWTVVGIMVLALFGLIGGGIARLTLKEKMQPGWEPEG